MNLKSADQRYKESGSSLSFKEWIKREKEKGEVIYQEGVTNSIKKELGDRLEKPVMKEKNNKVFGLDKRILILSTLIVVGAVAYKVYTSKK